MDWIKSVNLAREEGSFEKAMGLLQIELAKRPEDPLVHYQIAWTHDALGKERDAVNAYENAIAFGLREADLRDAYLGLGSTLRSLGAYEKSRQVLEKAIAEFPEYKPLRTFLSLTLFNLGQPEKTVEILLRQLVETTGDGSLKEYERALLFYADKLDQVFE